jgi:hypothetical protein
MGSGIQQPTVDQSSAGSAFGDVLKVLYEPGAVFERVQATELLAPFLAIIAVQCVLFFINLPYLKVAIQANGGAAGRAVSRRARYRCSWCSVSSD